MQQIKISDYPSNAFGRFWMKLPLLVRAVLIGFCVSSLGIGIWLLMASYIPMPWSIIGMGLVLILYWMYFSGKWKPANTQTFRRKCIRNTKLKRPIWLWGLMAALTIIVLLQSGLALNFRIHEFQPEVFKTASFLNDFPNWISWSIIIMASLVAGICEEVGFRGYMQKPLEQKYGPVLGISITSIVFVIVHLHQAWASGILIQIFVISFMIGYLAYSTKSLIPGIIAHVTFDIMNYSYWWSDVVGNYEHKPISTTGIDFHFVITAVVVTLSIAIFIIAINKLSKLKESIDFS